MSLGVLNNIAAIYAENNLNSTQAGLQTTLQQLSSGSRINSGISLNSASNTLRGAEENVSTMTVS